jgi:hypothetical protein
MPFSPYGFVPGLRQKGNDDNMIIAESGVKFDDALFYEYGKGINLG